MAPSRLKVLIADDDPVFQALAQSSLQIAGHAADIVDDGAAALEALRTRYDAVIVDLIMPNVDGFRLIALIRSTPGLEYLPIVVLSSRNDAAAVEEAYRLGADAFETKPVNWALFPLHLAHIVRTARTIADLKSKLARHVHADGRAMTSRTSANRTGSH